MKIIAFDTSSLQDSCTIYDSEKGVLSEFRFSIPSHKSETVIDVIKFNLSLLNLNLDDIDIISVCGGPGSFTGVRIGIATALGLSIGKNIKCCVVNILDILAYGANLDGEIISFLISSNNQVYYASYLKENDILIKKSNYLTLPIENFLEFSMHSKATYITEKSSKIQSIMFDNILTKSTIIAKIVSKYKKEDFDSPIQAFYF